MVFVESDQLLAGPTVNFIVGASQGTLQCRWDVATHPWARVGS